MKLEFYIESNGCYEVYKDGTTIYYGDIKWNCNQWVYIAYRNELTVDELIQVAAKITTLENLGKQ